MPTTRKGPGITSGILEKPLVWVPTAVCSANQLWHSSNLFPPSTGVEPNWNTKRKGWATGKRLLPPVCRERVRRSPKA